MECCLLVSALLDNRYTNWAFFEIFVIRNEKLEN